MGGQQLGSPGVALRSQGGRRAWIGGGAFAIGLIITYGTYSQAQQNGGGTYVILWGPMLVGLFYFVRGLWQLGQAKAAEKSGWKPDPTKRHQHRYWDGAAWTEHVATEGTQAVDPVPGAPQRTRLRHPMWLCHPRARRSQHLRSPRRPTTLHP